MWIASLDAFPAWRTMLRQRDPLLLRIGHTVMLIFYSLRWKIAGTH
jgi:hypothetical protein